MQSSTPRESGDLHVHAVTTQIRNYLDSQVLPEPGEIASATARFIIEKHNDIVEVTNKFEADNSNTAPDLALRKNDGETVCVNLYKIKNNQTIQPKNLGAKSFIEKYFGSPNLQGEFNSYFESAYRGFLSATTAAFSENFKKNATERELKDELKKVCPKFVPELEEFRSKFLYELREKCFGLFIKEYNQASGAIEQAFNALFMTSSFNVITRYDGNVLKGVEEFRVDVHETKNVSISKVGMNSVGITSDDITLLLRFKFESSPTSSIKLATSYSKPKVNQTIVNGNLRALSRFNEALSGEFKPEGSKANPNAIGKCSEAIFYSQILKVNSSARQLDENNFIDMFKKYSPNITENECEYITKTTVGAVDGLMEFLKRKHGEYTMDSIELVPDAYLDNRLDTADIELILKVDNKYVSEPISLKAIAKASNEINCKNPGIGQILGPTYFGLAQDELNAVLNDAKSQFAGNKLDHRGVLEAISKNIGVQLVQAANDQQEKIIKGAESLLGKALVVVVYYTDNKYAILEHDFSISKVEVYPESPSLIQTTLSWSDNDEEIRLRVKFSGSQRKGWTSVKLACAHIFPRSKILNIP
ncbi:hypothetical protein [Vibrio sp. 99-70-13A1]|uniref:hypothetical protein n=1 Tax=Vibrio sp. 99-70-13A1 TaxID=2607601 RepID=UPI0014937652|nr:hypothetical protein [Vibrio sp. 99-70-13A1]NOH97856.1 hypothetical protein [Vibrio sp. 99-70-13A1]